MAANVGRTCRSHQLIASILLLTWIATVSSQNSSSVEFVPLPSTVIVSVTDMLMPMDSSSVVSPLMTSSAALMTSSIVESSPVVVETSIVPTPSSPVFQSTSTIVDPPVATTTEIEVTLPPTSTPSPPPSTAPPPPPSTASPPAPASFPQAAIIGIAVGGGTLLLLILVVIMLCCCCYCCKKTKRSGVYSTGNENRPFGVTIRTWDPRSDHTNRSGSMISRGSRGSFARSSISSIGSALRRLSGKRRSKGKGTAGGSEDKLVDNGQIAMKVTPL